MSEERGRQESKGSKSKQNSKNKSKSPTRLQRGFSRMARGFALPKVNRATGGDGKAGKKRKDRVKNIKNKKKNKDVKREPAPKVTKRLEDILNSNNFVLWLGEEVNSVFTLNFDLINNILRELCEKYVADDAESKKEIFVFLNETKPDEKEGALIQAKSLLTAELGNARFDLLFTAALEKEASIPEADKALVNLTLTLAKAVNPAVVVYSGVDRNLEDSITHDNKEACSMTPLELLAFRDTVDLENTTLATAFLEKGVKRNLIFKIDGDIKKPHSLLLTEKEKRSMFGLAEEGEELSQEAQVTSAVLTELAEQMPIVFLGRTLAESDPVCDFLKNIRKGKKEGELGDNHVALVVNASSNDIVRPPTEEIGVDLVTYTPHDSNTHITEFLSNMATSTADISKPLDADGQGVRRLAAGSAGLAGFLRALSVKEQEAKYINIFVNSLEALPFVLEKSAEEKIVTGENEEKEENQNLFDAITERVAGLTNKVIPPAPEAPKENEETEVADLDEGKEGDKDKPKEGESKEAEAKEVTAEDTASNETFETVVRVLVSKKGVDNFVANATEESLVKVETCFGAIADSKGRLDIRYVELQDDIGEDFELLYTPQSGGVGDISLYHTVTESELNVYFYEDNTNLAEEKALLFDRVWTCAFLQDDAKAYFEATLVQAQTELGSKSQTTKGKKGRKFFKSSKRPLEDDPSKARDGFIKRTVKSIARSSKRLTRKGSKNITPVDAGAVQGESNWMKGKKKADEEVKKESQNQEIKKEEAPKEEVVDKKDAKEVEAATPVKATEEKAEKPAEVAEKKDEKAEPKEEKKTEKKADKKKPKKQTKKKPKAEKKAGKKKAKEDTPKPKEVVDKKDAKEVEKATPVKATEEKAEKPVEAAVEKKAEKKEEKAEKKEEKAEQKVEKKDKKADKKKEKKEKKPKKQPKKKAKAADKKKVKETAKEETPKEEVKETEKAKAKEE